MVRQEERLSLSTDPSVPPVLHVMEGGRVPFSQKRVPTLDSSRHPLTRIGPSHRRGFYRIISLGPTDAPSRPRLPRPSRVSPLVEGPDGIRSGGGTEVGQGRWGVGCLPLLRRTPGTLWSGRGSETHGGWGRVDTLSGGPHPTSKRLTPHILKLKPLQSY